MKVVYGKKQVTLEGNGEKDEEVSSLEANREKKILIWSVSLCFLSGVVDAIGFLGYGVGVTHVSGSFCKVSIEILEKGFSNIENIFMFVLSFFFGSVLSGVLVSKREFSLKKRYGLVIISIGIIIFASWLFVENILLLLSILSFLSGLQNGMFITYKGIVVRTTHVTGGITDLGVLCGKFIKGNRGNNWKIKFQFLLLLGFFVGGIVGTIGYMWVSKRVFALLSLGYVLVGIEYFLFRKKYYRELEHTIKGKYKNKEEYDLSIG